MIDDLFGELTFNYKVHKKTKLKDLNKISNSKDIFNYIYPKFESFIYEREVLYIIYLNKSHKILGCWKASEGGITTAIVPINMILSRALLVQASSIIMVHNHPSGTLQPSEQDIAISKKIKSASILLEMNLLDSLIVTPDGEYYSMSDDGEI